VAQREIGGLQGERFVDRCDGRSAKGRDGFDGAFLTEISPNYLVDFIDFDDAREQRLAPFDIGGETGCVRTTSEILDPATRIDEDQWRSFFSRSPLGLVPRAMPR
jgi:hypothetical protein